jgi:hypothetical protein
MRASSVRSPPADVEEQRVAVEVEQAGKQLARAEIAQRAEEDDDVVVGDQGAV